MIAHLMTVMRLDNGTGPTGMRCENCAHLRTVTGESRVVLNGRAHQSKSLTLFRCVFVPGEPWSIDFEACARFERMN